MPKKVRDSPNKSWDAFERIVVELWITRVLTDFRENFDEMGEDSNVDGSESLSRCDNDSHDGYDYFWDQLQINFRWTEAYTSWDGR